MMSGNSENKGALGKIETLDLIKSVERGVGVRRRSYGRIGCLSGCSGGCYGKSLGRVTK